VIPEKVVVVLLNEDENLVYVEIHWGRGFMFFTQSCCRSSYSIKPLDIKQLSLLPPCDPSSNRLIVDCLA